MMLILLFKIASVLFKTKSILIIVCVRDYISAHLLFCFGQISLRRVANAFLSRVLVHASYYYFHISPIAQ